MIQGQNSVRAICTERKQGTIIQTKKCQHSKGDKTRYKFQTLFIIKKTNILVATYYGMQPEKSGFSNTNLSCEHPVTDSVPWALAEVGGRCHDQRGPFSSAGARTGHFTWDMVPGMIFHYKWVSISGAVTVLLEISTTFSSGAITLKKYDGKKCQSSDLSKFTIFFSLQILCRVVPSWELFSLERTQLKATKSSPRTKGETLPGSLEPTTWL